MRLIVNMTPENPIKVLKILRPSFLSGWPRALVSFEGEESKYHRLSPAEAALFFKANNKPKVYVYAVRNQDDGIVQIIREVPEEETPTW
jgi:hypothetical protein